MIDLLVYSCVTGGYDNVEKALLASSCRPSPSVRYVLFSDKIKTSKEAKTFRLSESSAEWEIRPLLWKHKMCRRRTARWHKTHSHVVAEVFEYPTRTLWLDGSQRICAVDLQEDLVAAHDSYDLSTFKHPDRNCIYQELEACVRLRKDNQLLMRNQVDRYRQDGFPPYSGLVETACVLRKTQSDAVREFNKRWWAEIDAYSFRDQLSFNYVAWKLKMPYGRIPGRRDRSEFFDFVPHGS